jgi:hypothetical protein
LLHQSDTNYDTLRSCNWSHSSLRRLPSSVIELGKNCTDNDPAKRPSMKIVKKTLKKIELSPFFLDDAIVANEFKIMTFLQKMSHTHPLLDRNCWAHVDVNTFALRTVPPSKFCKKVFKLLANAYGNVLDFSIIQSLPHPPGDLKLILESDFQKRFLVEVTEARSVVYLSESGIEAKELAHVLKPCNMYSIPGDITPAHIHVFM